MSTGPALVAAAAGVGLGHAILPDHWVPLAVVGRTRRYSLGRVARLSALAGIAHVLVSVALGALILLVGLPLRDSVRHAQDTIVGGLLVATGIAFAIIELRGGGHGHPHPHTHDHDHDHDHDHGHEHGRERRLSGLAAVMVPFGAAASPDLTILPVFLAATTVSAPAAIATVVMFAAVTIGAIVGLTVAAAAGGYQMRGEWLERWGNGLTAGVLILIGLLVLTGTI